MEKVEERRTKKKLIMYIRHTSINVAIVLTFCRKKQTTTCVNIYNESMQEQLCTKNFNYNTMKH